MDWVPKHLDWIKAVGSRILQAKKLHVEDYANDITSGLVPFDELVILVVARMYHIHIGVVLRDRVWYTSSAEKPDEITFHLLFHSSVHYLDSCTGNWGYASPSHTVTVDITESLQAQLMSLVMVHKENKNPAKNPLPTTPLNLSQPSSTINQKLDELQRELDQKLDNLKGELDLKTDKENRRRKRKLDQSMESTGSSTSSRKHRRRSSSMALRSKIHQETTERSQKNVPQEHHRELQAINLILIWTAFIQRTIDMELNQRISKNKTPYSMLSKMYRMRKTSRCFLNHLMTKTTRNLLL